MSPFINLPTEITQLILSHLPNKDLQSVSRVGCQRLRYTALTIYQCSQEFNIEAQITQIDRNRRWFIPAPRHTRLTSFLESIRLYPVLGSCVRKLSLHYDEILDRANVDVIPQFAGRKRSAERTVLPWNFSPRDEEDIVALMETLVSLLRALPELRELSLFPRTAVNLNEPWEIKRDRMLCDILCVAAFPSAVPIPWEITAIHERTSHHIVPPGLLKAGEKHLEKLCILNWVSPNYSSVLRVLPAFFLPNMTQVNAHQLTCWRDPISVAQWLRGADAGKQESDEVTTQVDRDELKGTSSVTTISLTDSLLLLETLVTLLSLPRRLIKFTYNHVAIDRFLELFELSYGTIRLAQLLTAIESAGRDTLEELSLRNNHMGSFAYTQLEMSGVHPIAMGSLAGFTRLRKLDAPLWMLLGCIATGRFSAGIKLNEVLPSSIEEALFGVEYLGIPNRHWSYMNCTLPIWDLMDEVAKGDKGRLTKLRKIVVYFRRDCGEDLDLVPKAKLEDLNRLAQTAEGLGVQFTWV